MNKFATLLTVILVIAALWVGAWFFGASQIRNAFTQASIEAQRSGGSLSCTELNIDGLPFRYDVECKQFSLLQNDVEISVPGLAASIRIYQPTHSIISALGPAEITDHFWGTRYLLNWQQAQLSARTNGFALARVSLQADQISLTDDRLGDRLVASADQLQAHIIDAADLYDPDQKLATWGGFIRLLSLNLPELDIIDANARLEADIPGLPDDLRQFNLDQILSNWQNTDNKIKLHVLEADIPAAQTEQPERAAVTVNIVGEASLDEDYLLDGNFDLNSTGLDTILEPLVSLALTGIYLGDPSGDEGLYRAYSIRHGVLFAGNVPLFSIPAVK